MTDLYKKIKNTTNAFAVMAKESGNDRATKVITSILAALKKSAFNETKTHIVFLRVNSKIKAIEIEEIKVIADYINKSCLEPHIIMDVSEKEVKDALEIHVLFTNISLSKTDLKTLEISAFKYLSEIYDK